MVEGEIFVLPSRFDTLTIKKLFRYTFYLLNKFSKSPNFFPLVII
jgi:hypothetical protein